MKRAKTLTAGILATVSQAIFSIVMLVALFLIIDMVNLAGATGAEGAIVLMVMMTAVVLTALVLSIITIAAWNKDVAGYKKKKAVIISAVVFNLVVVLYQIIALLSAASGAGTVILYIIMMGMSIAAVVLWLIDLAKEGKKAVQPAQVAAPTAPAASSTEAKLAVAEEFAQKLAKIEALKKQGILTEEEYSEIKKSYVKDYIGK